MITTTVQIINKLGLHARASAKFVSLALRFQSELNLTKDGQTVNGKSIMAVMMLAANKGSRLTLEIEGPDETAMETALIELINARFGEEE
jgi:phosphocarrier protein HPr